ncbi:hypothetical protein BJV82DRAFT_584112 [Fennellomyces sp. T-0311]|nr:hypothetical protein BJV82DRAFT_584112 [Fennellomyces sp. T-0311]
MHMNVAVEQQEQQSVVNEAEESPRYNNTTVAEDTLQSFESDFFDEDFNDPTEFICPLGDESEEAANDRGSPSATLNDITNSSKSIESTKPSHKVFTATSIPHLTSSSLLSLELLSIIEQFNLPKEAHERLVAFANDLVTCASQSVTVTPKELC